MDDLTHCCGSSRVVSESVLARPARVERGDWKRRRMMMETGRSRSTPVGLRRQSFLFLVRRLIPTAFRLLGLYDRGRMNALAIKLNRMELWFDSLPPQFDGYTLIHISDTHLMVLPEIADVAATLLRDVDADLLLLTGDYQFVGCPDARATAEALRPILEAPVIRDGVIGILGNHDSHDLVDALEKIDVEMLINEHLLITRGADVLQVTGLDDVHNFFTNDAANVLAERYTAFRLALVHSPEMADHARDAGVSLYLTGHTHGGQICSPGGNMAFSALDSHHELAVGLWRRDAMIGYTSSGLGVGGAPVRFNSTGEIMVICLRRSLEAGET